MSIGEPLTGVAIEAMLGIRNSIGLSPSPYAMGVVLIRLRGSESAFCTIVWGDRSARCFLKIWDSDLEIYRGTSQ